MKVCETLTLLVHISLSKFFLIYFKTHQNLGSEWVLGRPLPAPDGLRLRVSVPPWCLKGLRTYLTSDILCIICEGFGGPFVSIARPESTYRGIPFLSQAVGGRGPRPTFQ